MSRNPDYSKSTIYKIYYEDPSIPDFYIGGTTNFHKRRNDHKAMMTNSKVYNPVHSFIRNNGLINKWKIEKIEDIQCSSGLELRNREQYYYDLLQPTLNTIRPKR